MLVVKKKEKKSFGCHAEGEEPSKQIEEDFNFGNNENMPPVEKGQKYTIIRRQQQILKFVIKFFGKVKAHRAIIIDENINEIELNIKLLNVPCVNGNFPFRCDF